MADSDLPRRSWRRWWRELPGYYRIAAWSLIVCVLVQASLVTRILVGLIESDDVKTLRKHSKFQYPWEADDEQYPGQKLFIAGYYGRWPSSIRQIDFSGTDEDLALIGNRCTNLERLTIMPRTYLSDKSLRTLRNCRKLKSLSMSFCEIDDPSASFLLGMDRLIELDLHLTPVDDTAVPTLKKLSSLRGLYLNGADVSTAAINEWRSSQAGNQNRVRIMPYDGVPEEKDRRRGGTGGIVGDRAPLGKMGTYTIRWSDGRFGKSLRLKSDMLVVEVTSVTNPMITFREKLTLGWDTGWFFDRERFPERVDGDYLFQFKCGSYASEPVKVSVENGQSTIENIVFRMPVTKDELLRQYSE